MTREIPAKLRKKFEHLIHNPATSGVLLIISMIVALLWANFGANDSYHHFWDHTVLRVG